jgi:Na+/proline symporter
MAGVDIAILAVYFAAVVGLGSIFYRGQKSLSDFFLAGRDMPMRTINIRDGLSYNA